MKEKDKKRILFFYDMILWFSGGCIYFYAEILCRGFSHFSMFVCGGLCFLFVGKYGSRKYICRDRTWKTYASIMLVGACIITGLEFVTGMIVNVILKWDVWDYSYMKYNLYGQICLAYTGLWSLLSFVCVYVYMLIERKIFEKEIKI